MRRGNLSRVVTALQTRFALGLVIVLGSIFGVLFSAGAVHAETCTWDADQATDIMSDAGNWTGCTLSSDDNLVFDGSVTNTPATWDNALTEVGNITFSTTTVVTLNANTTATSTGNVIIEYGIINMTSGATLRVGGNLIASSTGSLVGDFSGTVNSTTVQMYGTNKTVGGTGTTTFSNFTIDGSIIVGSNVTTTKTLTIKSTKTLNAGGYILNFTNTTTPFTVNGTFTASTSTVMYSGAGNTTMAGTSYYSLKVNSTAGILGGNATTTNVLTIQSAKALNAGGYALNLSGSGTPLVNAGTFTASTSTLEYSGASPTISSSTYYNVEFDGSGTYAPLTDLTVSNNATVISGTLALTTSSIDITGALSNAGTITQGNTVTTTFSGGSASFSGSGATQFGKLSITGTLTMAGNVTTTATTTIVGTLNAGGNILTLATTGTPFVITGTFNENTSTIYYSSSGSVTTTAETYYGLTLGTGTYIVGGDTTSTGAFVNGGTTTLGSGRTLNVSGTYNNNGTVTESGVIQHPNESADITDSSGTPTASVDTALQAVYVTVEDQDANLDATAIDTITGSSVNASTYGDDETITLTETGVDTGVFISYLPVTLSSLGQDSNGQVEVSGNGTYTLAFVDSKDAGDTGSDTAAYTGSAFSSSSGSSHGGGGGGGGSSSSPSANSTQPTVDPSTLVKGTQQGVSLDDTAKHEVIVGKTTHHVTRVSATDKIATIIVESTPIKLTLQKNELKKLDTNGDKKLDMSVQYLGFISGVPKFIFTDLVTVPKKVTTPVVTPAPVHVTPAPVSTVPVTHPITTPVVSPVVVPPLNPATPITFTFSKNLSVGTTGNDVRALQQKLKTLGYFTVEPNGVFGPMTKAAVIKFQKAKGIVPASGLVGPLTRKVLNSL